MRKLRVKGNGKSNMVFDLASKKVEELKVITKDGKEVLIANLMAKIRLMSEKQMTNDDHDKIVKLFAVVNSPEIISTAREADRIRISDFFIGYMVGKFAANTQSTLNIIEEPIITGEPNHAVRQL